MVVLAMTQNLDTLHAEEERLRGEHKKFVERDESLQDHIAMIHEGMNAVFALTHDHEHRNDDELTMQFLGIRLFNLSAASIKLAYSGYYQSAFSAVRDLLETFFLVDYLVSRQAQIGVWKTATKAQLKGVFGPNSIRQALDKRDGFTTEKRKAIYDLISHYATHATQSGFRLTSKNDLGEIGPFYREDNFEAWAQELVKVMANAGVVFGSMFHELDPNLTVTKAVYLGHLSRWKQKYFGGPDVWEKRSE
jgi:hypothetical protein